MECWGGGVIWNCLGTLNLSSPRINPPSRLELNMENLDIFGSDQPRIHPSSKLEIVVDFKSELP